MIISVCITLTVTPTNLHMNWAEAAGHERVKHFSSDWWRHVMKIIKLWHAAPSRQLSTPMVNDALSSTQQSISVTSSPSPAIKKAAPVVVDEPLLAPNPRRFVLFPIEYHDVRRWWYFLTPPSDMANVQEGRGQFLDCGRGWPHQGHHRLGVAHQRRATLYLTRAGLLCSQWWHREWEFSGAVQSGSSSGWGPLLLRLPNNDWKYPLGNVQPPHRHLHQRHERKKLSLWRHWERLVFHNLVEFWWFDVKCSRVDLFTRFLFLTRLSFVSFVSFRICAFLIQWTDASFPL